MLTALLAAGCGALVGCAEPAALAAPDPHGIESSGPLGGTTHCYAPINESPKPRANADPDPSTRALEAACGEPDAALSVVAQRLAAQQSNAKTELDVDAISSALRALGAPYVWPRAWLFNGSEGEIDDAKLRMQRWLSTFSDGGVRRCGIFVMHAPGGRINVGAVAVDALADLQVLPMRVEVGKWLDVRATLRVPAGEAKFVVLGPHGAPHAVPTSSNDGHVRARFNADHEGVWLVQLLAEVEGRTAALLEALVYAGVEPPRTPIAPTAPGEDAAQRPGDPRATLYAMVNAARRSEGYPELTRNERLEELAQAHAQAMHRARKTAHDAGDGDLNQRLELAGLSLTAGENVAHAGSALLAQRALWASPSHRENLLFPSFNVLGVGLVNDADGTVWVCQVFGVVQ